MIDLGLAHIHSGKVRDIYALGEAPESLDGPQRPTPAAADTLLMVTSDRISAFDVVMTEPIPHKGRVLTAMSAYWFDHTADIVPSHLISTDVADLPPEVQQLAAEADLAGRVMITRRADMLPVECIVRGYLSGTAWREYRATGTIHGMPLPVGLDESEELPEPMFTPSTKAEVGDHDENISFVRAAELVGPTMARRLRDVCIALYERAAARARDRGIIIADTKFELGLIDGELVLCDEVLTPDSSRFWPSDAHEVASTPPSFDKQPVRDYLDGLGWDKKPPPPTLPPDVVDATSRRYIEAYERITALSFADWPGVPDSPPRPTQGRILGS